MFHRKKANTSNEWTTKEVVKKSPKSHDSSDVEILDERHLRDRETVVGVICLKSERRVYVIKHDMWL